MSVVVAERWEVEGEGAGVTKKLAGNLKTTSVEVDVIPYEFSVFFAK